MAEVLAIQQDTNTGSAGFGQAAGVINRGQTFQAPYNNVTALSFQLASTGTQDMTVYFYAVNGSNVPTTLVGSFTIPNASLSVAYTKYSLPVQLNGFVVGQQYCFYLAPTSGGVYADDYRDIKVSNANPYANGLEITNNSGSGWTTEALDLQFRIYSDNGAAGTLVRPSVKRTTAPLIRRRTDTVVVPVPRGIALSGLEFASGTIPGSLNTNYFNSSQATFDYFARKGFNTVRIPFTWERIQPALNGSLDSTYAGYVDQQIQYAVNSGMKVVLDCHNYGRRFISSAGGFTSNFTSNDALWSGGTQGSGVLNVNNFQRAIAGNINNPVSPATSYSYQADFQISSNGGADTWRSLWLEAYRVDDNNKYFFTANNLSSLWQLYKVVNGTQTLLDSGTYTFTLGSWYTAILDIGQATPGKITVKLGPQGGSIVQISQQPLDAALTHGQITVFANGVNGNIDNVTLNVNGDTTSGASGTGNYTIGTTQVPNTAFANFWTQMSNRYKANAGVLAYDLMNEPHDMGTPTTPSNYTTSSWTTAAQAAINAIRANGDSHYIIAELDGWAGGQSFTTNYGASPSPWLTDTTGRLIYSFHYYFDSDHSGSYASGYDSINRYNNISSDLTPLLTWAKSNSIQLHCGEFGTPNTDDRWLDVLENFLQLCDRYSVWTNHWAAGDSYSSPTTLQPSNNVDVNQMRVVGKHLGKNVT